MTICVEQTIDAEFYEDACSKAFEAFTGFADGVARITDVVEVI